MNEMSVVERVRSGLMEPGFIPKGTKVWPVHGQLKTGEPSNIIAPNGHSFRSWPNGPVRLTKDVRAKKFSILPKTHQYSSYNRDRCIIVMFDTPIKQDKQFILGFVVISEDIL